MKLLSSILLFIACSTTAFSQKKADLPDDISADSSFVQATEFMFQGLINESISSFTKAVGGFEKSDNVRQVIACYLGMATCYSLTGDFGKSLEFNEKALLLHKNKIVNDPDGLDLISNSLALCKEAQRAGNRAIKID